MKCEYCEQELIWMHDEDLEDEEIVSIYWCSKCDVMFEMLVEDGE